MSAAFITWELSRTTPHSNCPQKKTKDIPGSGTLSEKLTRYKELCGLIQKPRKKCQKDNHQVREKGNMLKLMRENIQNIPYSKVY